MRDVIHVFCPVVDGQCGLPHSPSSSVEDGSDIVGELDDGSLRTALAHVEGAPERRYRA
jgi:hypothetical protein